MVALIERHHRKVATGNLLEFVARTQVTPVANRQTRFPADAAVNDSKHNQRQSRYQDVRQRLNFNQYDPHADADDEPNGGNNAGFYLTNPTINPQPGTSTINTAKTHIILGIPSGTQAICTQNPSQQSNPARCLGTILNLLGLDFQKNEIGNIPNIRNIDVNAHDIHAPLDFLRQKGVKVIPNTQFYNHILAYPEPLSLMVLIVGHVNPHDHKVHQVDIPPGAPYVVYMLLLAGRHCFLPFSYTNNNMNLGRSARPSTSS